MAKFWREAGRVFSGTNAAAITTAYRQLKAALVKAGIDPDASDDDDTDPPAKPSAKAKPTSDAEAREAGGFAAGDLGVLLTQALNSGQSDTDYPRNRIVDVYDDQFIYQSGWSGPFYAVEYDVTDDGLVTLGTPTLVVRKVQYLQPGSSQLETTEAGEIDISGDIALTEAAVNSSGHARIKLISPGWGSSGYYPAEVLKRDGPNVFTAGTRMFWDHPTPAEESARPEGSLTRWAATLIDGARYDPHGPNGAGLYATADVRTAFRQDVNDLASRGLGVSIRASGKARSGEIEGKRGPIIEAITAARSVDFVTMAGAGGGVLALFEAARNRGTDPTEAGQPAPTEETDMAFTEDQKTEIAAIVAAAVSTAIAPLTEANRALAHANDQRDAERIITARLAQIRMPSASRSRVLAAVAPLVERDAGGKIDTAKLIEATNNAASAEINYLAGLGVPGMSGAAVGFGESAPLDESNAGGTSATGTDDTAAIFKAWGMTDDAATIAARGRTA